MIDDRTRAALKSDIDAQLLTRGSTGWKEIQNRYPAISAATFWRVVREVKSARAGRATLDIEQRLPMAVPAEPVQSVGRSGIFFPSGSGNLSPARLIAEFDRLLEDAEKLRASSIDAHGNVVRPATFLQSAKMRERLIGSSTILIRELYSLKSLGEFYDVLDEAVMAADKDVARKVVEAITTLRQRPISSAADFRADNQKA
jgi:hypothetical protein